MQASSGCYQKWLKQNGSNNLPVGWMGPILGTPNSPGFFHWNLPGPTWLAIHHGSSTLKIEPHFKLISTCLLINIVYHRLFQAKKTSCFSPKRIMEKILSRGRLLQGLRLAGCLLLRPLRRGRGRGGHGETHGLHGLQLFAFACGATSTFGTEAGRWCKWGNVGCLIVITPPNCLFYFFILGGGSTFL